MKKDTYLFNDEVEYAFKAYSRYERRKTEKRTFDRYVVVTNHISIENVLFSLIKQIERPLEVYTVSKTNKNFGINEKLLDNQVYDISHLDFDKYDNTCFIFLVDTDIEDSMWMSCLENYKNCLHKEKNLLIVGEVIPALPDIPGGIHSLAEREYSFFIEKYLQGKDSFIIELERKCRETAKTNENIILLRFDNIYSSQGFLVKGFDLNSIVKEVLADHQKIVIQNDDYTKEFSLISASDAAVCVLGAALRANKGNVFNVVKDTLSIGAIKKQLFEDYSNLVPMETEILTYTASDIKYRRLDSTKFFHQTKIKKYISRSFRENFYLACSGIYDLDYDISRNLGVYQGKLQRLKQEELEMLEEVKRICQKHGIQYFLTAGSLIGAVRNNKSIPWDDDLDIGMLREDFEKFREVAPKELNEKYHYSSWITDPNVHYYFDKIRLKDTYFSTIYSSNFELIDGIFVDFIIYDQIANTKLFQKLHSFFLRLMYYLLSLKWLDRVPEKHHLAASILHPLLKLVSFRFLHKTYDFVAKFYFNKKHQINLIDGGTKKHLGPFPRSYLTEIEWVEFDGIEVPIPVHYDEFLSFFQGSNFRKLPPLSMRKVTHQFGRLDLGKYLFTNTPEESFREVNIKGELFEEESET